MAGGNKVTGIDKSRFELNPVADDESERYKLRIDAREEIVFTVFIS
jgi:hypothetical protein